MVTATSLLLPLKDDHYYQHHQLTDSMEGNKRKPYCSNCFIIASAAAAKMILRTAANDKIARCLKNPLPPLLLLCRQRLRQTTYPAKLVDLDSLFCKVPRVWGSEPCLNDYDLSFKKQEDYIFQSVLVNAAVTLGVRLCVSMRTQRVVRYCSTLWNLSSTRYPRRGGSH
jgi:hypothetical protein